MLLACQTRFTEVRLGRRGVGSDMYSIDEMTFDKLVESSLTYVG